MAKDSDTAVVNTDSDTAVTNTSTETATVPIWDVKNAALNRFFTGAKIGLDALHSGNASNLRGLKRLQLKYKGTVLNFAVNPTDYTQKFPNRVSMTQTKGGAWIDAWGAGVVEINIRGVTGVSGRKFTQKSNPQDYVTKLANTSLDIARVISGDSGVDEGYQRWRQFRDFFQLVYANGENGITVTDDDLITLNNYTDNEYWLCYPMPNGLELYRSQSKPHMYQYTISLWGLKSLTSVKKDSGVIGNPSLVHDYYNSTLNFDAQGSTTVESDNVNEDSLGDDEGNVAVEGERNLTENASTTGSSGGKQTDQNSIGSPVGGVSYKTQTIALDTDADITIQTTTKTKGVLALRADSEDFASMLAPYIGGYNGLLIPVAAYTTAKDLFITEHGTVTNITGFNKTQIFKLSGELMPSNKLLDELRFVPLVSSEAYKVWKQILNYSSEILTPEFSIAVGSTISERIKQSVKTSSYYGSSLYDYINMYKPKYYLTQSDIIYLKIIMLECMTLYLDLYKIVNSTGKVTTLYTRSDINTLIKNIQAMCIYLQFSNSEMNLIYIRNIMWELRQIETILHQVKTYVLNYL